MRVCPLSQLNDKIQSEAANGLPWAIDVQSMPVNEA